MRKIHSYRGFTFYYIKTSKQRGGGGYFHNDLNLGHSVEEVKEYIDWCFENPTSEYNLLSF